MEKIANNQHYNQAMAKSMIDKLFFLDMAVDIKSVVDFGCADGTLLKWVHQFCPDLNLFGYDNNSDMITAAKKNFSEAEYFSDFDKLCNSATVSHTLINLSSVIHEVYSYSSVSEIDDFWKKVFNSGFEYIAIRDMMFSESALRPTPIRDEMKVRSCFRDAGKSQMISEFESIHGPISVYKNFMHFLLKYRYEENWKREVAENYLPISTTAFFNRIPTNYEVVIYERYALPFTVDRVKRDFDVELSDNTHVKILLRKK